MSKRRGGKRVTAFAHWGSTIQEAFDTLGWKYRIMVPTTASGYIATPLILVLDLDARKRTALLLVEHEYADYEMTRSELLSWARRHGKNYLERVFWDRQRRREAKMKESRRLAREVRLAQSLIQVAYQIDLEKSDPAVARIAEAMDAALRRNDLK